MRLQFEPLGSPPPEIGVPIILRRLREWAAIERGAPKKDMTEYTLRALAEDGPAAREVIPVIEKEVMDELRNMAGSKNTAIRGQGRRLLRQLDPLLRRLDVPIR